MDRPLRTTTRRGRALGLALAASLALGPVPARAQIENLPKLGDPSGEELSPVAERRLGESVMRQIRRDAAYLDDADLVDYLNRFAAPLVATPAAGGQSFEFFAIRDASINAFALPGGYIGVHTGLLNAAESESEVAAVLAHEIGHVTQRHIARMLAQQKQVSMVALAATILSLLAARASPQAAMGGVMLGDSLARGSMLSFSREAEREADDEAIVLLRAAGLSPAVMVTLFERLAGPDGTGRDNAPPIALASHPADAERIARFQQAADAR